MRLIGKCHFDDMFAKIIRRIEDDFDDLAEDSLAPSLNGSSLEIWVDDVMGAFHDINSALWNLWGEADSDSLEYYEDRLQSALDNMIVLCLLIERAMQDGKVREIIS